MIRHLIPRARLYRRWSATTLTDLSGEHEEAVGFCLVVQWLGLLCEFNCGRVAR